MNDGCYYSEPLNNREFQILRLKVKRQKNKEIAEHLYLAMPTVKWYVQQIYSKLGVSNVKELTDCAEALGLLDEQDDSSQPTQTTLPNPITSFIGREYEISEISESLKTARLLTLSGTGGTGKTRLALEVAEVAKDNYRDGVFFVNLAPLTDPSAVPNAIAEVLGVVENREESLANTLKRVLQNRHCLLVLDNFEHVLESAPLASELLQACSGLTILVTSREILHLYGEQEYTVPPLNLPNSNLPQSLEALSQNEAIQLFTQRAKAVSRRFELSEGNISTVAQICTRLDGLPLAIELAAARCKFLRPDALLSRLNNRLGTLTGGARDLPKRQQTIRDTIAWSYDLLDHAEKLLFSRLSVFRGGRSLESCEAVCSEGITLDVFDGLASLIDKNLLVSREDSLGEPRFWMLETIHEYALECLEISDEAETIRKRHAEYFTQFAEKANLELQGAQQQKWLQRFEIEHDNLRMALGWTLNGGDAPLGVRLACAVDVFFDWRGHQLEGDHWIQHAMEYIEDVSPEMQLELLLNLGHTHWYRLDFLIARKVLEQALRIANELGGKHHKGQVLTRMAVAVQGRPEELMAELPLDEAIQFCRDAVAIWRELGDQNKLAFALNILGNLEMMRGDSASARISYEECIDIARKISNTRRVYVNLFNLARVERMQEEHEKATSLAQEALRLTRKIKDKYYMASMLFRIADPIGEAKHSTRLLAASETTLSALGAIRQPVSVSHFHESLASARENLSEEAFQQAWKEGSSMSLDVAVAYALDEIDPF
jgi:predicted ATPase/DNA-binding CsgD family transcriptional regulator